ncbi:hypothetical protein [Brevibacillus sp. SYP-B805]|uniref:hypothetical protein n=1 Tax=Brevibacillus sp. SYP-B805 TaxID=1578199 RepID=UPI001F4972F7|nr:hypothetical protein [Brevibacillus sp. SYP-B805]
MVTSIGSRQFGRYILFHRKLRLEKEEIAWCRWVLALLENEPLGSNENGPAR